MELVTSYSSYYLPRHSADTPSLPRKSRGLLYFGGASDGGLSIKSGYMILDVAQRAWKRAGESEEHARLFLICRLQVMEKYSQTVLEARQMWVDVETCRTDAIGLVRTGHMS
ncbi:hypothetical protein Ancab_014534 [Ancistrocladus abbreviatus]